MKRASLGLLVLMTICIASSMVCHAVPAYYNADGVAQAGLYQDPSSTVRVIVKIRYTLGTGGVAYRFCQAVPGLEKEILAVALTAQSSVKKVRYRTDLAADGLGDQTKPKGNELNPFPLYGLSLVD
jgi:hypothetical protein